MSERQAREAVWFMRKNRRTGQAHGGGDFDGVWWRVKLPPGWTARSHPECATFQREPPSGALQISSARKGTGTRVTDQDLRDFAEGRIPEGKTLGSVSYGRFSGFTVEYAKQGSFWKEWWLRYGRLMIYATYNTTDGKETFELEDVERILGSLIPTGA